MIQDSGYRNGMIQNYNYFINLLETTEFVELTAVLNFLSCMFPILKQFKYPRQFWVFKMGKILVNTKK